MKKASNYSFLSQLIPSRCRTLTIPVPLMQAQQRLDSQFAEDIYLEWRGWREPARYYRGYLSDNQLVMIGPKRIIFSVFILFRNYENFLYRTHGHLSIQGSHIVLDLRIQLNHPYLYILTMVSLTAFLIAVLVPNFGWLGIKLMLFYLGFYYVIVQWYLQYYSNEICQLIRNIITDSPINTNLDQFKRSPLNPNLAQQHKIPNYLPQAILVTLFFCGPLGAIAITYAARAISKYKAGDYRGAMKASIVSRNWCWAAFLFGVLAYVLITLLVTNSF